VVCGTEGVVAMSTKAGAGDRVEVELRIHGVSGTPPEVMLGAEHVRQVAGDERSRYFRPSDTHGADSQPDPTRVLEGYHWGQFTAGTWRQGLWLILIPFGLVNAAAFMLPDPRGHKRGATVAHVATGALIRLVGIGQTCTISLATALIFVDLLTARAQRAGWLKDVPDQVLPGLAATAAALVVLCLFLMGRQPRHQPLPDLPATSIAAQRAPQGRVATWDKPIGAIGLCRPLFYGGYLHAPTLSRLHLGTGIAVVALVVALKADQAGPTTMLEGLVVATTTLVGLASLLTTFLGDPEGSTSASNNSGQWHRFTRAASWLVVYTAPLLLVASVANTHNANKTAVLNFEDSGAWLVRTVTGTMLALLAANAVLAWRTWEEETAAATPKAFLPYARGMAPWAAASVGVFLGIGYSAAAVLATANALGVEQPSPLIFRIAYACGLTVVVLTVVSIIALATLRWRSRSATDVRIAYQPLWHPRDPQRSRAIASWHRADGRWTEDADGAKKYRAVAFACEVARLKLQVPTMFLGAAFLGLTLSVATTLETTLNRDLPWVFGELSEVESKDSSSLLADIGTYSLVAFAAVLLILGRRAIRTQNTRRGVNVIWDVVSFWPHSAHPFVPPPYSQTAVPAVQDRIRFHLGHLDVRPEDEPIADHVIVAPHSQGSLIAFASLLWLTEKELSKVGLVTFGSQLQVAFPRAFPAYLDYDLIRELHTRLQGRWINLYRDTDPIAGPVLSWDRSPISPDPLTSRHFGADERTHDVIDQSTGRRESGPDWRLLDPTPADNDRMLRPMLAMCRHSNYAESVDWNAALEAVRPHRQEEPSDREPVPEVEPVMKSVSVGSDDGRGEHRA
jgi:hypothetical protein